MRGVTPFEVVKAIQSLEANEPLGLVFDYDGTLAEIAPTPDQARLRRETRDLLLGLAKQPHTHVALITGRSLEGLLEMTGPLSGITLATNGGLRISAGNDDWVAPEAMSRIDMLREAIRSIEPEIRRWPGAFIEDKKLSFTVHFRLAPEAGESITRVVQRAVEASGGELRSLPAKYGLEVQPNTPWDKGRALLKLLERWRIERRAAFFGDDTIDEPGFVVLRARGGVTCCVSPEPRATEAELILRSVSEMNEVLRLLSDSDVRATS